MTEPKRPRLTSPFLAVKQLQKGGQTFSYIPTGDAIDRLNAVLGTGGWNFEVQAFRDGEWIIAHGRLEACGGVYEQYGGQEIKTYSSEARKGQPVDLGDEYKAAASDAFKKCCQSVGLGLYLALGHPPMVVEIGEPNEGEEDANKASGTDDLSMEHSSQQGQERGDVLADSSVPGSSPAVLTPGFSGEPM